MDFCSQFAAIYVQKTNKEIKDFDKIYMCLILKVCHTGLRKEPLTQQREKYINTVLIEYLNQQY